MDNCLIKTILKRGLSILFHTHTQFFPVRVIQIPVAKNVFQIKGTKVDYKATGELQAILNS